MSKNILEEEFEKFYGKPSWNVHPGYSSVLTLNFGQPILKIEEPRIYKGKQKRFTRVDGEWVLWIFGCDWKYLRDNYLIGHSESSKEEINSVTQDINGQAPINVVFIEPAKAIFHFDLGGRFETSPYLVNGEKIDQWVLFDPFGYAIIFGSDGRIERKSANKPVE